jgi:aminoglycoside phosphotransferase (APT) family kinase protein
MQKNWQRRYDFVELDAPTLTSMLQPAFPGKSVIEAEPLTTGLCNTNYKIKVSDIADTFVLRLYIRDPTACQKDCDIFNLVHNRVPVPELLYADVEGERFDTAYSVMKWVDGILLSDIISAGDVSQMIACAYAAGTTLASIGTYTFPQAGFFGPGLSIAQPFDRQTSPFLTVIEHFLFKGKTGQRLGTELTERLWQFVNNNAGYLKTAEDVAALVHSDFKGVNILVKQVQKRWHVAAVLDWEFAFANSPLVDIANMLRYDRLLPAEFETQFIRGYRDQGGILPAEWKRTSKLLDLLSLCEFLNTPNPNSALIEEVTGLIVGTIEHWEKYSRQ